TPRSWGSSRLSPWNTTTSTPASRRDSPSITAALFMTSLCRVGFENNGGQLSNADQQVSNRVNAKGQPESRAGPSAAGQTYLIVMLPAVTVAVGNATALRVNPRLPTEAVTVKGTTGRVGLQTNRVYPASTNQVGDRVALYHCVSLKVLENISSDVVDGSTVTPVS